MVSEIIGIIAIVAASAGAVLSTLKGYFGNKEDYAKGKLASSLIIAILGSYALINFGLLADQVSGLGAVGLFVTYVLLGFGVDQGLSRLDKS